ncbi:hypothetical protein DICVIV_05108 [Dictyocaulus viviparus]|uniref:Uncharacterized protein n=1 Tax=Dictyocaulus viviparus TaxID=29172 RepID=A0A0D8XVY6_DICVI|nr:hypothetical protein DICVIV_05108 [Dictyocaulus viviparus]
MDNMAVQVAILTHNEVPSRLQQLMSLKDVDERTEDDDRFEASPLKKKVDDNRKDDRRKKEKVTVESLFRTYPSSSERLMSTNRSSLSKTPASSNAIFPGQPASSSLVTAMYPPIRRPVVTAVNRPKLDVVRKKTLRALSVDMSEDVEENKNQAEHSNLKTADVLNVDDYMNRNVDCTNTGDPTSTRPTPREDDGKLPNLPNGYP